MSGISDFLAWLGGADLDTLRKSPRDRGRFAQMGCVLLTTAGIAGLSMTFAIHNTMHLPVPIAMIYGIVWALVIINLDRFLVLSMGSVREVKRLIAIAIPRLLMAIVVSLVVSTPITLEIFHNDIYATMTTMNLTQSSQVERDEANSALQLQVNTLQGKITADQQILDGKLPDTISSPQLQTAQALVSQLAPEVSTAHTAEINAYATWQCELYGDDCDGGSGRAGAGPIAQAKQAIYEQDVQTYQSDESQYKTAEDQLATARNSLGQAQKAAATRYQKQAQQALPGLRTQLATAQTELNNQNASAQYNTANNTGLLRQLQALFEASSGNPALLAAHLTVAALFFLIELLPVLVKLLLNLGQPTAYEQILKAEDEKLLEAVKADRRAERRKQERASDEEQQIADAASAARVKQALDMAKRQEGLGIKANDTVARKMEEILDAALAEWSTQVQATLRGGQVAPGQPPANGQRPMVGYGANGNANPAPGRPGYVQHPGYPQQSANGQPVKGHAAAGAYGPSTTNGNTAGRSDFGLPAAGDEL